MRKEEINLHSLAILFSLLLALVVGVKDVAFDDSLIMGSWAPESSPTLSPQLISCSSAKVELVGELKLLFTIETCSAIEYQAEKTTFLSQVFFIGKKVVAELRANIEFSLEEAQDGDSILVVRHPEKRISLKAIKHYFAEAGNHACDQQLLETLPIDFRTEAWAVRITMKDLKFGEPIRDKLSEAGIVIGEKSPEGMYMHCLENIFANILISGRTMSAYTQKDYKMLVLALRPDLGDTFVVQSPEIEIHNTEELAKIQQARVKEGDIVFIYYPAPHTEPTWEWFTDMPHSLPLDLPYVMIPVTDPEATQTSPTRLSCGVSGRDGLWPLRGDVNRVLRPSATWYADDQGPANDAYRGYQETIAELEVLRESCYDEKSEEPVSSDDEIMSSHPRQRYQRSDDGYGSERISQDARDSAPRRRAERKRYQFRSATAEEERAMHGDRSRRERRTDPQAQLSLLGQSPLMMEMSDYMPFKLKTRGHNVSLESISVGPPINFAIFRPELGGLVNELAVLTATVEAGDYIFVFPNEDCSTSILDPLLELSTIFVSNDVSLIREVLEGVEGAVAVYTVEAQSALKKGSPCPHY